MNRRGFLGSLLSLALAPVAAALPPVREFVSPQLVEGFLPVSWYAESAPAVLNDGFMLLIHPDTSRDLIGEAPPARVVKPQIGRSEELRIISKKAFEDWPGSLDDGSTFVNSGRIIIRENMKG